MAPLPGCMEVLKMDESKKKRYINKNKTLYDLTDKIKLWPSRSGILHGVKYVQYKGDSMVIRTHCNEEFVVWNSKNSRSARWLRNRWFKKPCPKCQIPQWKLQKYSETVFTDSRR